MKEKTINIWVVYFESRACPILKKNELMTDLVRITVDIFFWYL